MLFIQQCSGVELHFCCLKQVLTKILFTELYEKIALFVYPIQISQIIQLLLNKIVVQAF